ncbi:MAG: ABC transporter ATP-binding protein [Chloroflexi bacterium]|nr:ABC transporter ATP-binding protein [Chloroflexota bacterium]
MKALLRVFGYMRRYWFALAVAYACMLGINAIRLATPQIVSRIVDVGIGEAQLDVLVTSVLLLLGATVVQGIFRFGQGYLTGRNAEQIAYVMRNQVYDKLQSLSFSYHDRAQTGQLLSRATSDVNRLQRLTGNGLVSMVDVVVLLVGTTVVVLQMNTQLALLALATIPAIIIYMWIFYIGRMHPLWHERQDRTAVLTSRLEQSLRGISVVRGFAQEPAEIDRFAVENDAVYGISMRLARMQSFSMPFIIFLSSISIVLVLGVGGGLVISGALTLGELVAFNSYVLQLVGPARRIAMLFTLFGESETSAERVFEILDARSEVTEAPDAVELGAIDGSVAFDNVSFSYLGTSTVLGGVSFDIKPGQMVALLGPTGCGKSTVINLIPRFYDVTAGAIRIDGVDIRSVTLESLRRQIGIVLQETLLFGDTIRENIAFGRTDATQEEIEAAARAAAAHDFIMGFPNGYETPVGERGITLSGGQRQRVAIARALLLNPRILILDDATSSVDTETERHIQGALDALMHGRTSFVIAQRVSTVRNADLILVLDQGKVVAQGSHSELIRESGIYADIYYRQLRTDRPQPALVAEGQTK